MLALEAPRLLRRLPSTATKSPSDSNINELLGAPVLRICTVLTLLHLAGLAAGFFSLSYSRPFCCGIYRACGRSHKICR